VIAETNRRIYHHFVRDKVLRYIRELSLLKAGDRVGVAVSGGADSVALLRVLLDLRPDIGIVLSVAHFNHGLRADAADADQAFVAELAREHGLELFVGHGDVRDHAILSKQTIEAAARELRYAWFAQLVHWKSLNAITTGHTLDDQAETVLMKFLRGAGTRGLAGIYPKLPLVDKAVPAGAYVIRPLLCISRADAETYLGSVQQSWCADESNADPHFTRNRVRHELLPLLVRDYNPSLPRVLNQTADVARGEEEYWDDLVDHELSCRLRDGGTSPRLTLGGFDLPLAVQRRLLKQFLQKASIAADFEHVENLLRCAVGDIDRTTLPGGWLAVRKGECLELRPPSTASPCAGSKFAYALPVPGEIYIAELAVTLRAIVVPEKHAREAAPGTLLAASLAGSEMTVRNWWPGDRYFPAHSRSEEKLKRLFSESKIPEEERATWPVVLKDEKIVWVRGFPVAQAFAWKAGMGDALRIEELS